LNVANLLIHYSATPNNLVGSRRDDIKINGIHYSATPNNFVGSRREI